MKETTTNGRAAGGARETYTPREKVAFPTNKPVLIGLEFDPPQEPRPGRFGDQYMYFLSGNRIAFLDPPAHEAIVRSGAKAGDELALTKTEVRKGNRRGVEWVAELVQEEPGEGEETAPAAPQTSSQAKPAAAAPPAPEAAQNEGDEDARAMATAIRAAVQACRWSGATFDIAWDKADIRALATTIYISRSRKEGGQ
jgi:hypothetical protein